ncbi:kinase-like domain-containing protein [Armillaria novae-zelandiae]|uniref:Kinase-like domain-containing protein n=1 Tax=Armillaria novae-zelandiae TaxID=153914 RepID=A0AA39PAN1_9AGAR|nr:kinase-like domain-containing protein [Armillaria novae-zelandiae]
MRAFGLDIRTSGRISIRNENGSQYFAVKVFSIQASVDIGQQELRRHATMMSNSSNHPGSRHVAINCWSVVLAEPFSRLVCVMDLCGTCLTKLYLTGDQGAKKHWRIHVWRKLFRDMLLALDFLHSECGLVHGDIKGDDILAENVLDDNQLEELLDKEPVEFGESITFCDNLYTRDFKDTSSIYHTMQQPKSMPLRSQLVDHHMNFKLCDFGACHPIHQDGVRPPPTTSPRRQAPELVLGLPWDEKIDIWTLGNIVSPISFVSTGPHLLANQMLETLTYGPVFRGPFDRFHTFLNKKSLEEAQKYNAQDHLFAMALFSGMDKQFPRWMIQASPKGKEYFKADGTLKSGSWKSVLPEDLVQGIRRTTTNAIATEIIGHEVQSTPALFVCVQRELVEIIEKCFTLDPKKRPSAKELLQHDFFKHPADDGDGDEAFIYHLVSRDE